MNKCQFIGRLTKDPELKYTPNGTAVANFTLAVDRKFKQEGQPEVDFLPHVVWGKLAETIAKYCQKGSMLGTSTRVQVRSWEANDGTKKYATEFVVEEFTFAGGKSSSNDGGNKETSSQDEEFEL